MLHGTGVWGWRVPVYATQPGSMSSKPIHLLLWSLKMELRRSLSHIQQLSRVAFPSNNILGFPQRQRTTSFRLQPPVGHGLGHISDSPIYLYTLKGQWPPGDSGGWMSTLGEKNNSTSVWFCPALFPSGSWWCESKQRIALLFTEVWTGRLVRGWNQSCRGLGSRVQGDGRVENRELGFTLLCGPSGFS